MKYVYLAVVIFLIAYLNILRKKRSSRNIYQSVNDVLLSNDELISHAKEITKFHSISKQKKGYNYIFLRLKNNYNIITKAYRLLNNYGKMNLPLCPASEWLLDNFYIIEEQYKDIQKNMENKFYKKLYIINDGQLKNCPRIFAVALEIVSHTDGRIDKNQLTQFINAYQSQITLSMSELWSLAPMIKMALIEKIAHVCENIIISQEQWNKAESFKNKSKSELLPLMNSELSISANIKYSFIEHLLKIYKKMEMNDEQIISNIENYLLKFDTDIERVVNHEHQQQAAFQITIGNCITSIRLVISLDWEDIFDSLSIVEKILSSDPSGIYPCMDNTSRTHYRKYVENIANETNAAETMVARKAVFCSSNQQNTGNMILSHIGYYLCGKGKSCLYKELSVKNYKCESKSKTFKLYFLSILLLSILIINFFMLYAYNNSTGVSFTILTFILTVIPASELAITIINWIITHTYEPSFIPKLEFKGDIPDDKSTLVVVPTIFPDIERVKHLFEKLEVTYLSNHEKNIRFALLGDLKDADNINTPEDKLIIQEAINRTLELNKKYSTEDDSFYLFVRNRTYSSSQSKWIGWERKRGAIITLNEFLKSSDSKEFPVISGNIDKIKNIKYIITLDADTVLTIGTAKKLIGTISHPLNMPVIDEARGIVTDGYGLIQPRIGIDIQSSNKSLFAKIFAGVGGIDIYTNAISDVYQDLFQEGIYTGKGIYDLDVFKKLLHNAIPENTVLSHDLLEGSFIKVGLATDIELIDGFPEKFNSYMMRLQRWVRGDWQLIKWLYPYVQNREGIKVKNPLNVVSKWKIFDNLRRSLVQVSIIPLLYSSFLFLPGSIYVWLSFAALVTFFPLISSVIDYIYLKYYNIPIQKLNGNVIYGVKAILLQSVLLFMFLPYQSFLLTKSICKTLYRIFVSKKNLLEWVTAADAEKTVKNNLSSYFKNMAPSLYKNVVLLFVVYILNRNSLIISGLFVIFWSLSPFIGWRISLPVNEKEFEIAEDDILFLRKISIKTWNFYKTFADKNNNYLPIDNYQIRPIEKIAHRTSPTNIGFLLISILSAKDLGYLNIDSFILRLKNTLATINKLEKWNGNLFNWYDTKTLEILNPRYISTVDSGNLVGYYITLKQGLIEIIKKPVFTVANIKGILDTALLTREFCQNTITYIESFIKNSNFNLHSYYNLLNTTLSFENELNVSKDLAETIKCFKDEIEFLFPKQIVDLQSMVVLKQIPSADIVNNINSLLKGSSLIDMHKCYDALILQLSNFQGKNDDMDLLCNLKAEIIKANDYIVKTLSDIYSLIDQLNILIDATKFKPLFDEKLGLFSIGYNVQDNKLTNSYYDLLASEARITSYLAVIRKEIPVTHWFKLGRSLVNIAGYFSLVSWTGTMFEYLMPALIMKNFKNSLFDETYFTVVKAQIKYGKMRKLLWGTSESGFYTFDLHLNYQYKAFGVPDLGLKRGLINDMVVSPYSTILALTYCPNEALKNLKELTKCNIEGTYGLYEAVDFTPSRIPYNKNYSVVESFMAHHQGMILTSINNFLNSSVMVKRFHSEPVVKSGEFLLQEKVPLRVVITKENKEEVEPFNNIKPKEISVTRESSDLITPMPICHILSNGNYTVMINNKGTGYSKNENIQLTRWHEDSLSESSGYYIFLRNILNDKLWSSTYEPTCIIPDNYKVKFSQDKADFIRMDNKIETRTEICVSPEDNCEIRRITITNHQDITVNIECTSYLETVLNSQLADIFHPAYSNLFVRTEFMNTYNCILASRRPRSSQEDTLWLFHSLIVNGITNGDIEYETSRYKFIGRNKNVQKSCSLHLPLSGTAGAILDPIMSLRQKICLEPYKSAVLCYTTGFSRDKQSLIDMVHKYNEYSSISRAFDLSFIRSQMSIKFLNLTAQDITCFDDMLSHIFFQSPMKKVYQDSISKNIYGQSGLWSFGISGDLPIILIMIDKIEDIDNVKMMVKAHEYYRSKGLRIDLVILNEDESNYLQPLQNALKDIILSSHARDLFGSTGGIYILNSNLLNEDEKNLLITSSRIIMHSDKHIRTQIKTNFLPENSDEKIKISKEIENLPQIPEEELILDFYNGYGGFNQTEKEYVITLKDGLNTPAPWSNIIANENFGFLVTESGSGYIWSENSRENKLTPWSNDPVTDPPGEIVYLRDDDTGKFWSITSLPIRDKETYTVVHGLGYTIFRHNSNGITQELEEFVPQNENIKLSIIKLSNYTEKVKNLSVYYYIKPVLGVSEYVTSQYIHTEFESNSDALLCRNCFSSDYPGRLMYISSSLKIVSYTGNRNEFLGKCNGLCNPDGLNYRNLSNVVGSCFDPCCVIQNTFSLNPGEKKEFVLLLGQEKSLDKIESVLKKYKELNNCKTELNNVESYWKEKNDSIQIETPDKSIDALVNNFLLYQVISSRLWARCAFYQSGGAFGFRDQLQDILCVIYTLPETARKQILLHSNHQFIEGDVLHWWHPGEHEKGIRTRFSDDLLWLAFVTAEYILKTGDYSILSEKCSFVEGIVLNDNEDEKYGTYSFTDTSVTVYEHCILAIERALKFGIHGIPLMGSGDWNDGMNTVGNKGSGESVWLGWFICSTLKKIIPICKFMKDSIKTERYTTLIDNITNSIDENAWDGNWYKRAYFDDGTPLGSSVNHECKIDSIAQSWAVISNAPNTERLKKSMQSVMNYLVKKDDGLILLFTPPFDEGDLKPGYIKGYVPGVRENGGQYTHAAVWVISAFAKLKDGNTAVDLFNMINPINHTITQMQCLKYKVEPYVLAADVYSFEPHSGRGGWTWYTGSASWMYKTCIEDILGFTKSGDILSIHPCIPDNWKEAKLKYKYQNTTYNININRVNQSNTICVNSIYCDGIECVKNEIKLVNDKIEHIVNVTI